MVCLSWRHVGLNRALVFVLRVACSVSLRKTQPTGPLPPLSDWAQRSDIIIDDWENILRQIRITQGLLDELLVTPDAPPAVITAQRLRLGRLCYYVDRLPAARTHLEEAAALAIYP